MSTVYNENEQHTKQLIAASNKLNILLLGETGVGKSTWINGLANYVTYSTLEDALSSGDGCSSVIPASFTLTNSNYEAQTITIGNCPTEIDATRTGESCTQVPNTYVFQVGQRVVRLIDTPGIGDTRGVEQDKYNFQLILDHVAKLDKLHGICILLKPNNSRITAMFQFCISKLLANLHSSACQNIVFCFTHCRESFYRPGESLTALRELLKSNERFQIPLSRNTVYCIDNEAIRYLAASAQRFKYGDCQEKEYAESWKVSFAESERLFAYLEKLEAHDIQNTLSLNQARRELDALIEPLAVICCTIQTNISQIEFDPDVASAGNFCIPNFMKKDERDMQLSFTQIEVKIVALPQARLVCRNDRCMTLVEEGNTRHTKYLTECRYSTPQAFFGRHLPRFIIARMTCNKCGHSFGEHYETKYEFEEISLTHSFEDSESIQKHLRELHEERHTIIDACAKFTNFLKHNSVTLFNDAIDTYVQLLIQLKQQNNSTPFEKHLVQNLESMRASYSQTLWTHEHEACGLLTLEGIMEKIASLKRLKYSSTMLEKFMMVVNEAEQNSVMSREIVFHPAAKSSLTEL